MYKIAVYGGYTVNLTPLFIQMEDNGDLTHFWYFSQLGVVWGGQKLNFINNGLHIWNQHQQYVYNSCLWGY